MHTLHPAQRNQAVTQDHTIVLPAMWHTKFNASNWLAIQRPVARWVVCFVGVGGCNRTGGERKGVCVCVHMYVRTYACMFCGLQDRCHIKF